MFAKFRICLNCFEKILWTYQVLYKAQELYFNSRTLVTLIIMLFRNIYIYIKFVLSPVLTCVRGAGGNSGMNSRRLCEIVATL